MKSVGPVICTMQSLNLSSDLALSTAGICNMHPLQLSSDLALSTAGICTMHPLQLSSDLALSSTVMCTMHPLQMSFDLALSNIVIYTMLSRECPMTFLIYFCHIYHAFTATVLWLWLSTTLVCTMHLFQISSDRAFSTANIYTMHSLQLSSYLRCLRCQCHQHHASTSNVP
jgi:hypothetical protein